LPTRCTGRAGSAATSPRAGARNAARRSRGRALSGRSRGRTSATGRRSSPRSRHPARGPTPAAGRGTPRLGGDRASIFRTRGRARVGTAVADADSTLLLLDLISCRAANQDDGERRDPVRRPSKHRAKRRPGGRTVQGTARHERIRN
jgi:hypothetical protein